MAPARVSFTSEDNTVHEPLPPVGGTSADDTVEDGEVTETSVNQDNDLLSQSKATGSNAEPKGGPTAELAGSTVPPTAGSSTEPRTPCPEPDVTASEIARLLCERLATATPDTRDTPDGDDEMDESDDELDVDQQLHDDEMESIVDASSMANQLWNEVTERIGIIPASTFSSKSDEGRRNARREMRQLRLVLGSAMACDLQGLMA